MSIDIMEQMRGTFGAEALDLLIELDSALLALEAEPGDTTLVHRVFRVLSVRLRRSFGNGFSRYCRFYFGVCSSRGNVLD